MEQDIQYVQVSSGAEYSDTPLDSDIIHLNVAGTSIIVLSSAEAVNDLFERRSAVYSDRQVLLPSLCMTLTVDQTSGAYG
jgi:hypothetical protein